MRKKPTKRSKNLKTAKKVEARKPLSKYLTYKMTDVQISNISTSSSGGSTTPNN